ncbi:LAMI_0C09329g1_1 [Lachancea mirantina]|uniref:LAMI_0C09329g1_1 n=1 Tax=Lachancea mirantina TaxID=1230905 RepID=A0A1G4J5E4_9SACH|nr:LAMI_0C09329g1_1 [Lachancea mirantina]
MLGQFFDQFTRQDYISDHIWKTSSH